MQTPKMERLQNLAFNHAPIELRKARLRNLMGGFFGPEISSKRSGDLAFAASVVLDSSQVGGMVV